MNRYKFVVMASRNTDKYCSSQVVNLGTVEDCNDDGVEGDLALVTKDGGIVATTIDLPDQVIIGNGARLCGNSAISPSNVSILGNFILENVTIGSNCLSVAMDDNDFSVAANSIVNSKICNKVIASNPSGTIYISGPGIKISSNSEINGDLFINGDTTIIKGDVGGHGGSNLGRSLIQNSTISIFDFIGAGSTIKDSEIIGSIQNSENNFTSIRISSGTITNNSSVKGIGYINGTMNNGLFNGWEGFFRYDGYLILHLFASGSITNNGLASQNGWIAGSINNGGFAQFYGTAYLHSGVSFGASIGQGGSARCYSQVIAGELKYGICHQAFNEYRTPQTMNIDDWIAGKPWPFR